MLPEDRGKQAEAKREAISALIPPDLSNPDAAEYFDTLMPSHIIEDDSGDEDEFALSDPFAGSITGEEFKRLVTTTHPSASLSRLTPDRGEIEYIVSQYVMPAYQRGVSAVYDEAGYLVPPSYESVHTARVLSLSFLGWFYGRLVENPKVVPDQNEMADRLLAIASETLSKDRRLPFELGKRLAFDAAALATIRSLTNFSPDRQAEEDVYYMIVDELDDIAGSDDYDPLSKPGLVALIERVIEFVEGTPHAGIGDYEVWQLAAIFKPREMMTLEACARHWRNPDEWTWDEVLRHTGLYQVMNEKMLRNTAVEVRRKLEERPDLRASLGIDQSFGEW
jgi:hypothetical protein